MAQRECPAPKGHGSRVGSTESANGGWHILSALSCACSSNAGRVFDLLPICRSAAARTIRTAYSAFGKCTSCRVAGLYIRSSRGFWTIGSLALIPKWMSMHRAVTNHRCRARHRHEIRISLVPWRSDWCPGVPIQYDDISAFI